MRIFAADLIKGFELYLIFLILRYIVLLSISMLCANIQVAAKRYLILKLRSTNSAWDAIFILGGANRGCLFYNRPLFPKSAIGEVPKAKTRQIFLKIRTKALRLKRLTSIYLNYEVWNIRIWNPDLILRKKISARFLKPVNKIYQYSIKMYIFDTTNWKHLILK